MGSPEGEGKAVGSMEGDQGQGVPQVNKFKKVRPREQTDMTENFTFPYYVVNGEKRTCTHFMLTFANVTLRYDV